MRVAAQRGVSDGGEGVGGQGWRGRVKLFGFVARHSIVHARVAQVGRLENDRSLGRKGLTL